MKRFDQVAPWPSKVNYVDANNVVLGFDMERSCCEDFGHAVVGSLEEAKEVSEGRGDAIPWDITAYSFIQEAPANLYDTYAHGEAHAAKAFRIIAPNKPDLFVIIWNHHNGYYSHGFTFEGPGVVAISGGI